MSEESARRIVRERCWGRCELCRAGSPLTFAHRRNRSHGGAWAPSNGLALCGSGTTGCHGWTEANPTWAYQGGWRIHGDQTPPSEVPVWLNNPWPGWWLLDDQGGLISLDADYDRPPPTYLPPGVPTHTGYLGGSVL